MFNLALIQMLVQPGERDRNLAHAVDLIAQAKRQGADVTLLPEVMDLGWTHASARSLAEPIPDGGPCRQLRDAARRHNIYICSGLTQRDGDRVYNSAVLIDPDGEVLLTHRKINELDIGHHVYDQGDRLAVAHTPIGDIGVMICADGFANDRVLSRSLGYMGADVILSPSAWCVPPDFDHAKTPYGKLWNDVYASAASEFRMWIAGVSNVGPVIGGAWDGYWCIGCSLVMKPDGKPAAQGPYGRDAENILIVPVTLEPRPARGTGWASRL